MEKMGMPIPVKRSREVSCAASSSTPLAKRNISHYATSASDTQQVCKFFLTQDGCTYGEKCRSKHVNPNRDSTSTVADPNTIYFDPWSLEEGIKAGRIPQKPDDYGIYRQVTKPKMKYGPSGNGNSAGKAVFYTGPGGGSWNQI